MKERRRIEEYADIIALPHPEMKRHPRMDRKMRAAQFAPFAALTGHGNAVENTNVKHEDNVNRELIFEADEEANAQP
ncbi:MAG: hypothetical protein IK016_07005 [Lachnospiraceae bacterium]|nr:hypothetical protein [Lachnospiraceae bacterium]